MACGRGAHLPGTSSPQTELEREFGVEAGHGMQSSSVRVGFFESTPIYPRASFPLRRAVFHFIKFIF